MPCRATTSSGNPCRKPPKQGTDLCSKHTPPEQLCGQPGRNGPCNRAAAAPDGRCHQHTNDPSRTELHCGAKARHSGQPCRHAPVPGGTRCRFHGGNSPQARAAAERRLQEAAARRIVQRLELNREVNPTQALLEEVYRAAGVVAWLDDKVQALSDAADAQLAADGDGDKESPSGLVWGVTEEVTKESGEYPGVDTTRAAVLNIWVKWWQEERDRLRKVCKDAISAGIEERRVRLAEQQGRLLGDVIRDILQDLELTPQQQRRAAEVVPWRLREVVNAAT